MPAYRRAILLAPRRLCLRQAPQFAYATRSYATEAAEVEAETVAPQAQPVTSPFPPRPTRPTRVSGSAGVQYAAAAKAKAAPSTPASSATPKATVKATPTPTSTPPPTTTPTPTPRTNGNDSSNNSVTKSGITRPREIAYNPPRRKTEPADASSRLPALADTDWRTSFYGIATQPVTDAQWESLMEPLKVEDIEIKPDGVIYLPEIKYRRRLNEAFGPMGWGLIPRGETVVGETVVTREYALIADGR